MTWSLNVARTNYTRKRTFGASVLLPLLPDRNYQPRVMILGGDNPATASTEVIDLSQPTPAWRSLLPMSAPRIEMNAVILPSGRVLALGGSGQDNVESTASLGADLFDPETETWTPAGVARYARLYHSVALLLPDATVWTAGSNPSRACGNRTWRFIRRPTCSPPTPAAEPSGRRGRPSQRRRPCGIRSFLRGRHPRCLGHRESRARARGGSQPTRSTWSSVWSA